MPSNNETPIGLDELIEQVKRELLPVTSGTNNDTPLLFVDSVELELQVTLRREGKGAIKVNVVSAGGELGGGIGRDDVHKVKVKLSPLFDQSRLMEFYQTLHPDRVPAVIKQSLEGLFKGQTGNLNEDLGG